MRMKKQLLTVALGLLCSAGAMAQSYSFYDNAWRVNAKGFYTENDAWAQTGFNLLTNGDLTVGDDKLEGWGNADGSKDGYAGFFEVQEGTGPNGANSLVVLQAGTGASATATSATELFRSVDLEAGSYVVGYWVKGSTTRTLGTSIGDTNGQVIFINNDATRTIDATEGTGNDGKMISTKALSYTGDWKEIFYQFTITDAMSVQFCFSNLQQGDEFANFGVYKVVPGFDARPFQKYKEELAIYEADEVNFPNNRDYIEALQMAADEILQNDIDADPDDYASQLTDFAGLLKEFLDDNTYLLSEDKDYFSNFLITSNTGMNKGGTGWNTVGGRWGTAAANNNQNLGHFPENFGFQDIQNSYALDRGVLYKTSDLPAGRYMFKAQVHAAKYQKGTDAVLGKDRSIQFGDSATCALYINSDTLWVKVSPTHYTEATIYGTVNDGEELNFGVVLPGTNGVKTGGNQGVRPLELRLLGGFDKDQINDKYYGENARKQQAVLEERIATAREMLADTKYVYGKQRLTDSIAVAQAAYEVAIVATPECVATKLNAVNMIKKAWQAYEADNKEYTQLGGTLAVAEENLADDLRPNKTNLQPVYNAAKQYYESITGAETTAEDSLAQKTELLRQDTLLVNANANFLVDNASYNTPAVITLVNPDVTSANGWYGGYTGNGFGYDSNWGFVYNRNYRAASDWMLRLQDVEISQPGVYEFSARVAANKFGAKYTSTYVYLQTHQGGEVVNDGDNQHYVVSTEANPIILRDSVMICTPAPTDDEYTKDEKNMIWAKTHVVVTDASKKLTVGLNGSRNNINGNSEACCQVIFGKAQLLYYGPYDKYLKDSIAVVMKPTKDSLQIVINNMQQLLDDSRNPNQVDTTPFSTAIATAQNVHDNSDNFDEVNAQFGLLESARQTFVLSGVYPAQGKYFDLSFLVKNPEFVATDKSYTTDEGGEQKTVTKFEFADWTEAMAEGQTFRSNNGLLYGVQLTGVEEIVDEVTYNRTKMTQKVAGLPAGAYSFGFNATFHGDKSNGIFRNVGKKELYVTTPTDTVAASEIVQDYLTIEGPNETYNDQYATYLIYNENLKLQLYDYRHGVSAVATMISVLDADYYLTLAKFDVKAGEEPELGFYLQDMVDNGNCPFFLANPTIHFYGDDANREEQFDGIAIVEKAAPAFFNGAIYNLSGQKVNGKPAKGLYIMNGKKFIVK